MSCWQNSRATGTLRNDWQAGKLTWSLWKCLSMSTKAENVRSLNTRETFTAPRLQIFIIHAKVKSLSYTLSQLCSETFPTVVLWVLLHKIWHSKNESYTQCKQWARPKTTNLQDVNVYKLERWHRLECGKILILSPGQNNVGGGVLWRNQCCWLKHKAEWSSRIEPESGRKLPQILTNPDTDSLSKLNPWSSGKGGQGHGSYH